MPPGLEPAVEVAAYRIASEAMTNVLRHAAASTCRVKVAVEETQGRCGIAEVRV